IRRPAQSVAIVGELITSRIARVTSVIGSEGLIGRLCCSNGSETSTMWLRTPADTGRAISRTDILSPLLTRCRHSPNSWDSGGAADHRHRAGDQPNGYTLAIVDEMPPFSQFVGFGSCGRPSTQGGRSAERIYSRHC